MMRFVRTSGLVTVLALAAAAVGCSGGDGEISVANAASAPTDAGEDKLFTVKVESGREEGYALAGLEVKATPEGKSALVVACTPADANGNQKLDAGESLACAEGATNLFGKDAVGKEIDVELFAQIDGKATRIGSATWKP